MPHRSHARWKPAFKAGNIGDADEFKIPKMARNFPRGTSTGDGMYAENRGRPYAKRDREDAGNERTPPSRYCNPAGFFGLHGNMVGKNWWEKEGGIREVKRQTDGEVFAVRGQPIRSRGR